MTLPSMTLQELRLAAQQRADMVSSDFLTTEEWNGLINDSLFDLYDKLIEAQPTGYFSTLPPYSFATDGTSQWYALPSDFYKLQGVDLVLGTAPNGAIGLKSFNFAERNKYNALGGAAAGINTRGSNLRYRLLANKLQITPLAQGGQTIQIWYVPKMAPLVDIATITLTGFNYTGNGTEVPLVVDGDEIACNGYPVDLFALGTGVLAGMTNTGAATLLAAALNLQFGETATVQSLGIVATASGNVVTCTIPATVDSVALTSNTSNAVCSSDTIAYGTTEFDGFSGWLAWVYLDAARKALIKEESDTSAVERELAKLDERIGKLASNRDVSAPSSVVDVNATGNGYPGDAWGDGWER